LRDGISVTEVRHERLQSRNIFPARYCSIKGGRTIVYVLEYNQTTGRVKGRKDEGQTFLLQKEKVWRKGKIGVSSRG